MIVGTINNFCLESSYSSSAKALGYEVLSFDPDQEIKKHIKLGKMGRMIYDFLNVEVWARKMNRELIVKVKRETPDVLLVTGGSKIFYGTLSTIKVILPSCKLVWIWPDTPMNLNSNVLDCSRLFDVSATYSKSTLPVYKTLGFNNVHWIPLAGDLFMHLNEVNQDDVFKCDISFVGMWRPEREKYLKIINDNFGHLNIEIYGNYWERNCQDKQLLKKWKGSGFYAKALSDHFKTCRININIIDDTNYPAANMRFFEIPTSGGLQVCSSCPEFEEEFVDKRDVVYFNNEGELIEKIKWILEHSDEAHEIRMSAQSKIKETHNYTKRLQNIIQLLNATQS